MSYRVSQILEDALQLPPVERAAVVEKLLASLDRPDTRMDELWAQEAKAWIAAFNADDLRAYDAEEVFAELDSP